MPTNAPASTADSRKRRGSDAPFDFEPASAPASSMASGTDTGMSELL